MEKVKPITILLVNPSYAGDVFEVERQTPFPVGLGYVAQSLKDHKISYKIVDLNFDKESKIFNCIRKYHPKYLGVSMMSYRASRTYKIIEKIKKKFSKIKIVIGGPHVIAVGTEIFKECPSIEILVVGEGEKTIIEILKKKSSDFNTIEGLLFKKGSKIITTQKRPYLKDINVLSFPRYHGFELNKYETSIPINSSRGCVYGCIFCGARNFLGNIWRGRDAKKMFEEMMYWRDRGYKSFSFSDSLFSINKKRILDFCDMVINGHIDVKFTVEGARADHMDLEILKKMKQANFTTLIFGVESANDSVLKTLNPYDQPLLLRQ